MRIARGVWLAVVTALFFLAHAPAFPATQSKPSQAKSKKAKSAAKKSKAASSGAKKSGGTAKGKASGKPAASTTPRIDAIAGAGGRPITEAQVVQEARAAKVSLGKNPRDGAARDRFARSAGRAIELLLAAEALGDTTGAERLTKLVATEFEGVGDPLRQASARGDAKARQASGVLHTRGLFMEQDAEKACGDFRTVADQLPASGWYAAQCLMEKEPDKAWDQMERAASGGHAIAQEWMGRRCLGEFGAKGKDFECAREWLTFSASQGRPRSQTLLAYLLNSGAGGVTDRTRAIKLYRLAAGHGDPDAQNNLAELYEMGRGVEKSLPDALRLYEAAADRGLPAALFNAGRLLAIGVDGHQDLPRARVLLTRAEEKGVSQARRVLEWLDQAANASSSPSATSESPDPPIAKDR